MYPEIKGRLQAIDKIVGEAFHIDKNVERMIIELRGGLEFLAKKVWALEHPPEKRPDPQGHLPGDDD